MDYLLDTHTFVWFSADAPELSPPAKDIIEGSDQKIFVSMASFWELGIKQKLGKLKIERSLDALFDAATAYDFVVLPINRNQVTRVTELPLFHRDPFDRMIISQAMAEGLTIITRDREFARYPVPTFWS